MVKTKPNYLAAALKEKAGGRDTQTASVLPLASTSSSAPRRKQTTSREGRVMVSGWLPIEARSSFKLIQAKYPEKRMQDLVTEAMNDLFAKYNVPQTAKAD